MKLFISHSDADKALATKFVEMLQLGVGASHTEIFYSSLKGAIPNGEFFVQYILKELNSADIVIALLSPSYFNSHFCLAEAGSALARKTAGSGEFLSFVVPPVKLSDLDGVLYGVQSGSILDRPALGELKDRISAKMTTKSPATPIWDQKRDAFLELAGNLVEETETSESINRITATKYKFEIDDKPTTTYHKKLRIVLRNGTGRHFELESGHWTPGVNGISLYEPLTSLPWQLSFADEERSAIHIPKDATFQTWIGLAESVGMLEVLQRAGTKRTGTLRLALRIGSQTASHELQF
jgi:hypothetical protein